MLSGGGRQVLASYTAFSYQGNFSDVACRLIDTLPHQSPAVRVSEYVQTDRHIAESLFLGVG